MTSKRGENKLCDNEKFMSWWQEIHEGIIDGEVKTFMNCELNLKIDVNNVSIGSRKDIIYYCDFCEELHKTTVRKAVDNKTVCEEERKGVPRNSSEREIKKFFSEFRQTSELNKMKVDAWIYPPNNFKIEEKDDNEEIIDENDDNEEKDDNEEIHMPPVNKRHNEVKTPELVSFSTNKKYWFKCFNEDCGHVFDIPINDITRDDGKAYWCRFCNFKKLCDDPKCERCFNHSLASLDRVVKAWINNNPDKPDNPAVNCRIDDKTKKQTILTPRKVAIKANFPVTLRCDNCFHIFDKLASDLHKGSWCGYCHGSLKLCDTKDNCWICTKRSFSTFTDKDKVNAYVLGPKNYNILPTQIYLNSHELFWFKCYNVNCGKEFQMTPNKIVQLNSWCPCCDGNSFCDDNNCIPCYYKSFASFIEQNEDGTWNNDKVGSWCIIENGDITPRKIFKCSGDKYNFVCYKCCHIFDKIISNITVHKEWCPYCCIPVNRLCDEKSCKMCFNNSFASSEKSIYFSQNNSVTPRSISRGSNIKINMNCDKCQREFTSRPHNISRGTWCPFCTNKTEDKLLYFLDLKYDNVKFQVKFDWCINFDTNKNRIYDFVINDKIILELDGQQHFEQVSNWKSPIEQNKIDRFKIDCALDNNYSIIHIYQPDVWNNKNDWDNKLISTIEELLISDICKLKLIGIDEKHFLDV